MNNTIIYKIRVLNNKWTVAFLDNETGEYTIISDDVNSLRNFLNRKKNSILIGANNYTYDDIVLASVIKYGNLTGDVSEDDIVSLLPITLDVSQGIVRNNLINYNNMVCSLWDNNGHAIPYQYALKEEEVTKQLKKDLLIIHSFSQMEDRNQFLKWKMKVIEEFGLEKKCYRYSYGNIMREILGLKIDEDARVSHKITIDPVLKRKIEEKNDVFLNELLKKLSFYYGHVEEYEKHKIEIGNCTVKFNPQGILGSLNSDFMSSGTNKDEAFLYIDFNSFGPNILINNNWLDKVAEHPNRYSELKDRRIALKAIKNPEQLYYKFLLNSGLDYLNKVTSKDGMNVGASLTITGIMTMMLLYRNLEQYGIELIECNTDGFIIKCSKKSINKIREEVKKLESELSLSCDVDVVKKIVHFDTMNYVMEFENGTQKHLGCFGNFQVNPLYISGITAVEIALREYYLNGVPVSVTLRQLRNENNLSAFQIIKKPRSNEKIRYVKIGEEYYPYDRGSYRLFAVRKEAIKNQLYVKNKKDNFEEDKTKRGKSVKDGFYYFDLSDQELPDIRDIDLTYYIGECYKIINAHPINRHANIITDHPKRNCFIDIDGTIIKDKEDSVSDIIFYNATKDFLSDEERSIASKLFYRSGGYLVQFLGLCKKTKAYGTIDNFAKFLYDQDLFPGRNINTYKHFVSEYIKADRDVSSQLEPFYNSKNLLEYLQSEGYNSYVYSNWFDTVQRAKLESNGFDQYFKGLHTIDNSQAKPSLEGWKGVLQSERINSDDFTIMIGNGTSDLVPKTLNIPSVIINHGDKPCAKTVLQNGIVIYDFSEVTNPNFYPEMEKIRSLKQTIKAR